MISHLEHSFIYRCYFDCFHSMWKLFITFYTRCVFCLKAELKVAMIRSRELIVIFLHNGPNWNIFRSQVYILLRFWFEMLMWKCVHDRFQYTYGTVFVAQSIYTYCCLSLLHCGNFAISCTLLYRLNILICKLYGNFKSHNKMFFLMIFFCWDVWVSCLKTGLVLVMNLWLRGHPRVEDWIQSSEETIKFFVEREFELWNRGTSSLQNVLHR